MKLFKELGLPVLAFISGISLMIVLVLNFSTFLLSIYMAFAVFFVYLDTVYKALQKTHEELRATYETATKQSSQQIAWLKQDLESSRNIYQSCIESNSGLSDKIQALEAQLSACKAKLESNSQVKGTLSKSAGRTKKASTKK